MGHAYIKSTYVRILKANITRIVLEGINKNPTYVNELLAM